MSGVRIRVDVDDADVRRVLGSLSRPLGRQVWAQVGQTLVSATLDRFEAGRGPDDVPWKPSRRAEAQGGQTLVDSSRLRDSVTFRAAADGVEVGTNVVYAAIHQFGSPADGSRPRGIPARPYLGVDDGDRDAIRGIVLDAIERRASP